MENKDVLERNKIEVELIKLVGGERLLRVSEPRSGGRWRRNLTRPSLSSAKRPNSSAHLKRLWLVHNSAPPERIIPQPLVMRRGQIVARTTPGETILCPKGWSKEMIDFQSR